MGVEERRMGSWLQLTVFPVPVDVPQQAKAWDTVEVDVLGPNDS